MLWHCGRDRRDIHSRNDNVSCSNVRAQQVIADERDAFRNPRGDSCLASTREELVVDIVPHAAPAEPCRRQNQPPTIPTAEVHYEWRRDSGRRQAGRYTSALGILEGESSPLLLLHLTR